MKAPRIAFVGRHNSGKTTILTAVLPLLVAKGIRVGYLKHAHAGLEIDQPEKDSYRIRRTGVLQTIVTGGGQTAVIDDAEDLGLDAAIGRYAREDLDLLVVEGFKADFDVSPDVPHFGPGDAPAIADFIAARISR